MLCELVPGGIGRPIYVSCAARILEQVTPPDAVAAARCELAAAFLEDLRHIDCCTPNRTICAMPPAPTA